MPSSTGSPKPGIEPTSPAAPALQADSLLLSHQYYLEYSILSLYLPFHHTRSTSPTPQIFMSNSLIISGLCSNVTLSLSAFCAPDLYCNPTPPC